MKRAKTLRRRNFIGITAGAAASGAAVSCSTRNSPWRFLTAQEGKTLEALCDQIIPADQDPGAVQAGVVNFIDRQLLQHLKPLQPVYRQGLAAIESASAAKTGKSFTALSSDEQTAFLKTLDSNLQAFFDTVLANTMQGFYGDPRHGGNHDAASWKMLRVPLMPTRGRAHYDLTKKPV